MRVLKEAFLTKYRIAQMESPSSNADADSQAEEAATSSDDTAPLF